MKEKVSPTTKDALEFIPSVDWPGLGLKDMFMDNNREEEELR